MASKVKGKSAAKAKVGKKNPADLTGRNLRAMKTRLTEVHNHSIGSFKTLEGKLEVQPDLIDALINRVNDLEHKVADLEARPTGTMSEEAGI